MQLACSNIRHLTCLLRNSEKFRRLQSGFLLHAGDQCTNIGCRKTYQPTQIGVSALLIAGRQGHVNAMAEIIGHNPDACDLVDNRGWTPLHAAIANERLNVVRYILKKPMLENLINAVDNEGNTPLNVAARRDKYSIITILVNDLRVQKKAQNLNFQKPIDFIRTNPNIEELCKSMIAKKLDSQEGRPSLRSLVHGMDIHEREVG
ncbi:hypothetical protein FEM48_Zijuj04G0197000 [Ziziphus jujuba var. spinosa]|uniref:Uncharacterized protein n=1 Tax=Ziziphus jujuba var. spinosa TaxID=714518 RepID=A0A978VLT7_ZIZJJ|nr:hypothetical protein FEM48_Zijuj04G0197000 [Ziziphus jujuba var. spinosa]